MHSALQKRKLELLKRWLPSSGDFKVKAVKEANFSEIFFANEENADAYFKARLAYVTLGEHSGEEKKTYTNVLVQAADLRDAVKRLDEGMKGTLAEYKIISIAETKIMDVYLYKPEEEKWWIKLLK